MESEGLEVMDSNYVRVKKSLLNVFEPSGPLWLNIDHLSNYIWIVFCNSKSAHLIKYPIK